MQTQLLCNYYKYTTLYNEHAFLLSNQVMVTVFLLIRFLVGSLAVMVLASRPTYATKQNGYFDTSYVHQHTTNGSSNYDENAATAQVINDIMNIQLSNNSIRSSPECWMTSISTISRWGKDTKQYDGQQNLQLIHTSGSSYCAAMTIEQKEVLALELTNCQLMKEKRQIYDANREMDAYIVRV